MTTTPDNLKIWDQVCRVPKEHLKGFKRAGGFTGTAIKPMWSIHRMTEIFGPCGDGWGIDEPLFKIVEAGDEIMVYCTVGVWYSTGTTTSKVFGVGGDKVRSVTSSGPRTDDEAFKKAFTDAVTNALKHLGVGADVHMGLWDGNKYIDEKVAEPEAPQQAKAYDRNPIVRDTFMALQTGLRKVSDLGTLDDLAEYWASNQNAIKALPADWKAELTEMKDEIKETLRAKAA